MTIVLFILLNFLSFQGKPLLTPSFIFQRIRPPHTHPVRPENCNVPCLTDDPASMFAAASTSHSQTFAYPSALVMYRVLEARGLLVV